MKKSAFFLFFFFILFQVDAQQKITASINNSCEQKPATLNIPGGKTASAFKILTLTSGNNCYTGAFFNTTGFVIKASNGNVIFRYNRDSKGHIEQSGGTLTSLQLKTGTYTIWVDGGKGAQLTLSYRI